jgi:FixJ family two-component response regulator
MTPGAKGIVALVDDDHRVLGSLADLLQSAGYEVRSFLSATAFLSQSTLASIDCLLLTSACLT